MSITLLLQSLEQMYGLPFLQIYIYTSIIMSCSALYWAATDSKVFKWITIGSMIFLVLMVVYTISVIIL